MTGSKRTVQLLFRTVRILCLSALLVACVTGYRSLQRDRQQQELLEIGKQLREFHQRWPMAVYGEDQRTGALWDSAPGRWLLANTDIFKPGIERLVIPETDASTFTRVLSMTTALSECRELYCVAPSAAGVQRIADLPALELVYVDKLEFVDQLIDVVLRQPRIERLAIVKTEVTAEQLGRLKSATWLKWLLLPNGSIDDPAYRELRDALPDTYVMFACSPPVTSDTPEFASRGSW